MSRLAMTLLGAAAFASTALPVFAQPLVITVPGGTPVYESPVLPPSSPYPLVSPPPPIGGRFDPAQAAINAMATVPWARHAATSGPNPVLVETLLRTGDSFAEHWARCQAQYGSYSIADDTYLDAAGIPRACLL
jgi:hypothetical protein